MGRQRVRFPRFFFINQSPMPTRGVPRHKSITKNMCCPYCDEKYKAYVAFERKNLWVNVKYHSFWFILLLMGIIIVLTEIVPEDASSQCCIVNFGMKLLKYVKPSIGLTTLIPAAWLIYSFITNYHVKILSEYNAKFYSLRCIYKTTDKIQQLLNSDKNGTRETAKLDSTDEAFYRFFEEMELCIKRGSLKSLDVFHLFAYYALAGILESVLKPEDFDKGNWELLRRFVARMKPLYDFYKDK